MQYSKKKEKKSKDKVMKSKLINLSLKVIL